MFRRLYWVSEQVFTDGTSKVNGVYTSIPDLVRYGLQYAEGGDLRLTLTKLDSSSDPLGTWISPGFGEMETAIQEYVTTEEISSEHVKMLINGLSASSHAA